MDLYDPHVSARSKIDEEIAQLEARLISLRSARNALAPIGRLHPEVLQEIFSLVHHASPHKGKLALLLTWISHQWRELAQNTSIIWRHIDFTHHEWVKMALSRTRGCALEFEFDSTGRKDLQTFATLIPCTLGNLSRIKKLKVVSKLDGSRAAFPKGAQEWLIPAPLLVELDLQGLSLPRDLFSGTFPSLRTLSLSGCSVDWDKFPVTQGLKDLSLAFPQTPATIDVILRVFQVIGPGLETLELNYVFLQGPTAVASTLYTDRFKFEDLQALKLSQGANHAAVFLDHISLPHRLNIEISTVGWVHSEIFGSLVSCRGVERWPVDHLEINIQDYEMRLRIVEARSDDDSGLRSIDNNPTYIQFDVASDQTSDFLHIFNSLPMQPIKKVSFVGGYGEAQDLTVLDYIGKLGTIQELRIEHPFMQTLLRFIKEQGDKLDELEAVPGGQTGPDISLVRNIMSFHELQVLEVYSQSPRVPPIHDGDILVLQKWLDRRSRAGLQSARLSVSRLETPPSSGMNGISHEATGLEEQQWGNDEEDEEDEDLEE